VRTTRECCGNVDAGAPILCQRIGTAAHTQVSQQHQQLALQRIGPSPRSSNRSSPPRLEQSALCISRQSCPNRSRWLQRQHVRCGVIPLQPRLCLQYLPLLQWLQQRWLQDAAACCKQSSPKLGQLLLEARVGKKHATPACSCKRSCNALCVWVCQLLQYCSSIQCITRLTQWQ
jgi:hypothetical protein